MDAVVLRWVAGARPPGAVRRRTALLAVLVALAAVTLLVPVAERAGGDRCDRFAAASRARAAEVTGEVTGAARVVVIGDSWSVGLGLDRPAAAWPSRLPGEVHVAGFSGSGFSEHASGCGRVSFADRAPAALRGGADLVVVEGGLNGFDQPDADVRTGFARLMEALAGRRVVVVGPANAPSRAHAVPHVDALLASLAAERDVPYVRTSQLRLTYLPERLHLTATGHVAFGDAVAARLRSLGLA